mgnify:CR=1 FL=1
MKLFYDKDANLNLINNLKVAVFGYGSQGHAHSKNLKDSGANVVVALRENSKTAERAVLDGFPVVSFEEGAKWADFIMLLLPDQVQRPVYEEFIEPNLRQGQTLGFAHGFNIHYGEINPPENVDVVMIAPKSPGHLVRKTFEDGQGTPCLVAVHQNASGNALENALSYSKAIGGTRAGTIETNFKDETETDLFGEQAVLCGGAAQLVKYGFETLTEAGYPEELAYFECLHELKLIVDLFYEGGLSLMNYSVSDTAEYGGHVSGRAVLPTETKDRMKAVLRRVQDGSFAKEYLADCANGQEKLKAYRQGDAEHGIEKVGKELRSMMPWLQHRLVKENVSE